MVDEQELKVKRLHELAIMPSYSYPGEDAGLDLCAVEEVELCAGKTRLVHTGIAIELPSKGMAWICSRSGLALHHDVIVFNAPGIIDAGYRGEIGVILKNAGDSDFKITRGMKIAQMIITLLPRIRVKEVAELNISTSRGGRGYGSTGEASKNSNSIS